MNKDKLQQQLEELKAKVAEMEAELKKPKKFKLEYIDGQTFKIEKSCVSHGWSGDSLIALEHGRCRKTEEGAKLSLARNKRANRLEALVEQCGGIKEFSDGDYNYHICSIEGEWEYFATLDTYEPEKVYMTKQTAIKVCKILNAGEYKL